MNRLPLHLTSKINIIIPLTFLLMIFTFQTIVAQPGDTIDSLITAKNNYKKNEAIDFSVRLNKNSRNKPYHVRIVETISCSCDSKDFYYVVYRIPDSNFPGSNRKAFIDHTEKENAPRCACKVRYAEFYENKKYSISAINEEGNYIIEIKGFGFTMYSNFFSVTK